METASLLLKFVEITLSALSNRKFNVRQRLNFIAFKKEVEAAFDRAVSFLEARGLQRKSFQAWQRDKYVDKIISTTIARDKFYYFYPGELERKCLDLFVLPSEKRVDVFLKYYCLRISGGEKLLLSTMIREHAMALLGRPNTVLHYISIPGWEGVPYKSLLKQIVRIKRPSPISSERFLAEQGELKKTNNPRIYKTIEVALKEGKISQLTVLNLASSQKLLLVLKYSEGVGEVYKYQKAEQETLESRIQRLKTSNAKSAAESLASAKAELARLKDGFSRAPINTTLERHGFQKIFRNMDGVYVIPLHLLPAQYHGVPELFLEEVVLEEARKERSALAQKFSGKVTIDPNLQFIILAHVLQLGELIILARDRELAISSPELYKTLFANYLLQSDSGVSQIYVNDVVRNVDFASLLSDSETANFIRANLDELKRILWENYQINLLIPIKLAALSQSELENISIQLVKGKKKSKKFVSQIRRMLMEKVVFYRDLAKELDALKRGSGQ